MVAPALTIGGSFWARSNYGDTTMLTSDDTNYSKTLFIAVSAGMVELLVAAFSFK